MKLIDIWIEWELSMCLESFSCDRFRVLYYVTHFLSFYSVLRYQQQSHIQLSHGSAHKSGITQSREPFHSVKFTALGKVVMKQP